jgi:hypothetical protein
VDLHFHFSNTPSWRGAQLKHRDNFTFTAQSLAWKCPTSAVAKKFKSQPSAGKITLTLFWDMEGAIFVHFTING